MRANQLALAHPVLLYHFVPHEVINCSFGSPCAFRATFEFWPFLASYTFNISCWLLYRYLATCVKREQQDEPLSVWVTKSIQLT